jgi:hypothetical protein
VAERDDPAEPTGPDTAQPTGGQTRETETVQTDLFTTDDATVDATITAPPRRRGPDPLALLVGLATLVMAVFAFVGELPAVDVDPRWLLAGGAAAVGLVLLVSSLRGRPRGGRGRG